MYVQSSSFHPNGDVGRADICRRTNGGRLTSRWNRSAASSSAGWNQFLQSKTSSSPRLLSLSSSSVVILFKTLMFKMFIFLTRSKDLQAVHILISAWVNAPCWLKILTVTGASSSANGWDFEWVFLAWQVSDKLIIIFEFCFPKRITED